MSSVTFIWYVCSCFHSWYFVDVRHWGGTINIYDGHVCMFITVGPKTSNLLCGGRSIVLNCHQVSAHKLTLPVMLSISCRNQKYHKAKMYSLLLIGAIKTVTSMHLTSKVSSGLFLMAIGPTTGDALQFGGWLLKLSTLTTKGDNYRFLETVFNIRMILL